MSHRRKKHRIRWHSIYLWHRYMGLSAAVFVVLLAVTGLMLNHTVSLNLDSTYVQSDILLDWYNISHPDNVTSYPVDDNWITQLDRQLYLNEQPISQITGHLTGAVEFNGRIVTATDQQIILTTNSGELIERLSSADGLPVDIQSIGTYNDTNIILKTKNRQYATDSDFIDWQPLTTATPKWSRPADIPEALLNQLLKYYRGKGLTLERVMLDIHSGRILGSRGVYLVDTAAVLFILLAAAGIWVWAKRNH